MLNDDRPLNTIVYKSDYQHNSLTDGVLVPGLQMLITGVLSGLTVAVLAGVAGAAWWYKAGGVAVVLVMLLSWLYYRGGWQHRLEVLLHIDLDSDGTIGAPPPPALPASTKYLTPVYVHDDPENRSNSRVVDIETHKDDTLERMAVVLATRGWQYFTCDNFTNSKSETQLMSYDHWQDVFLPAMIAARLVTTTVDSKNRRRSTLTPMGQEMFLKLAGAVDRAALPVSTGSITREA